LRLKSGHAALFVFHLESANFSPRDSPGLISDSNAAIISGKHIATTQLSSRYKVFVTPTILFLDGGGSELAERMIGINTP
jgi:hypothetical protein